MSRDHPPGAAAAAGWTSHERALARPVIALVAGAVVLLAGLVGVATDSVAAVVVAAAATGLVTFAAAPYSRRDPAPSSKSPLLRFIDRNDRVLAVATRHGRKAGVICVRVHGLEDVERGLGDSAFAALREDLLIRIRTALRRSDDVHAIAKDTFVVALAEVSDAASLPLVVEKILEWIEVPFAVRGDVVEVRGTAGASVHPEDGLTTSALMARASRALHVAERAQMPWVLYAESIEQVGDDAVSLTTGLKRAIVSGELVLHYQPQVDLRDGRVRSVEVFLRWEHPERGTLYPPEFLALAEHAPTIRGVARFVLEEALLQCATWIGEGMDLRVAVNLSGKNLLDPELPDHVAELLNRWKLDPGRLEIEIPETDIPADADATILPALRRLHELGVRVTIDDFGTGQANLAQLRKLPVDQIKIDRSFVLSMDANEDLGTIVRSAIALARSLGIEVAAEGVETETVWDELIDLRCDAAQGFFVSRPVPANKLFSGEPERAALVATPQAGGAKTASRSSTRRRWK